MSFIHRRRSLVALFLWMSLCLLLLTGSVQAGQEATGDTTGKKSRFYEQNEKCFRCHGNSKYTYFNKVSNKQVTAMMCDNRVILRNEFYTANHKSFACTDCHAAEYDSFPHPGTLRMESQYICIDCHGNDEKYAKYHFEEIEKEFQQSTHYTANADAFTCWKCHNPHTYKISIRNSNNITKSIAYDNQICLNCHSDFERFQLLTNRKEINLLQKHEWLPNQALHFSQVRCIECHARLNDSLLVSHRIMPKEKAVKRCVECHSQNSLLMSSLYKYQAKKNRTQAGFLNSIILNNAFVIGANRNILLNRISIVVFLVTIGFLIIHHILYRINKKRS
jgi:predicted CXXCH cytochrome family protein